MKNIEKFREFLKNEVIKITGRPISIPELREKWDNVLEQKQALSKTNHCANLSANQLWREKPRDVKFLTEEVFPLIVFFEQYDPATILKLHNDNRNYDAELLSNEHRTKGYIEISFPQNGAHENQISKTLNKYGAWVGEFSDANPADKIRHYVLNTLQQKSEKNYPANTSLLIFSGTICPGNDDFDNNKLDANIENSLDQTTELMKNISNNFSNIWFIDRHPPHKIRTIK